jgi:DNA polymerase-4
MNQNNLKASTELNVLFVDMNSFFASCEQQVNYWLRGRPVGVCVYTGKYGCVIAPSIEAKKQGIKTGMRLNDAIKLCPDLVPLETHPDRYRDFHKKIIGVLRKYSDDVIPKSIDEAVINFRDYKLVHKDLTEVAKKIKLDIHQEAGDWLKCSIGIAPNAFLAKLGSSIQKPDGLTIISPENIDDVLRKLRLTNLPGIGKGMSERFERAGIKSPLDIRYATPEKLRAACQSIVGLHWHYRLNFSEVDLSTSDYKSMQAMRQISKEQRQSLETINELLLSLCMKLESRMNNMAVHARHLYISTSYINGRHWNDKVILNEPLQDGMELLNIVHYKMEKYQTLHHCEPLINQHLASIGVGVSDFVPDEAVQYNLFDNRMKKDILRKTMYSLKEKYGKASIMKAAQIEDSPVLKDAIGFGSVKDLYEGEI